MNSVDVESEPVNCDQGNEKAFINTLLGEMKNQFNRTELKVEYLKTEEEMMHEDFSSICSPVKVDVKLELEKAEADMSTNEHVDIEVEDTSLSSLQAENKSNEEDLDGKPRIVLLFKKPNNESPSRNKDNSPGRRSLRNKNNCLDDKIGESVLKRSSRRRSKDCNESILQSAIARKEKSYNESNKPQRLTRQLKPTQKILENLAYAKQEKIKIKSPKLVDKNKQYDSDNEMRNSDDTNEVDITPKKNKKHTKTSKRNLKKLKTSHNIGSSKESDSDQSLSPDMEPNLDGSNKRRSQRISSSRSKEELDAPSGPSPNIADQAKDFPNDPECSSVGAQLIASRLCLCTQKTKLFADANDNEIVYCTAVDSIGEKLIGCSRIVNVKETSLLRPSQRVPYIILCDLHRNRMLRHNCCPTCGVFCTQGNFVECDAKHQYHRDCQISVGSIECCPHCGLSTPSHDIVITMHCSKTPVFLPIQKFHYPPAKMSFPKIKENPICTPPLLPFETFQIFNLLDLDGQIFSENDLLEAVKNRDINRVASIIALDTVDLHFKISSFNNGNLLHYAAHNGLLEICHLLVSANIDIDEFDKEQNTPLMIATTVNKNDVVQYLVQAGASITIKGTDGMTALHMAAKCGNLAACKILLQSAATIINFVNSQDDGGWTPLVWACEHGYVDVANYLIVKGADPCLRDVEHNEALHWAAFSGSSHVVELLLNRGCNVNIVNAHGETPLHIGAREDRYNCVIVLLARGANVSLVNKNNETALDCVPEDGESYAAIALNVKLQSITGSDFKKYKTILSNDISRGRETNPIQCVNTIDDEPEPQNYVYITKNCVNSDDLIIDKKISTLHTCTCMDRCLTENCECSKLSLKCWYDEEGKLTNDFSFADAPMIFECSEACSCNAITCRNRLVQKGLTQRFQLYKTDMRGWGIKTLRFIPKGTYVCEYMGEIMTDIEADQRDDDSFLFDLDNRDNESFCIDAKRYGNFARFINHCCSPNLHPVKVFVDHQDLRFPRIAFFAKKDIVADEELSFDYGHKFWLVKYKLFTCQCGTQECRYSNEAINETLISYKQLMGGDSYQSTIFSK